MDLIDKALKVAGEGFPVFPCRRDKHPAWSNEELGVGPGEGGFKIATKDPERIRELFAHKRSELIGVPTGPVSGIDVIDVDVKDGKGGQGWYDAHITELGLTRWHKTRSGGLHLVYACNGTDPGCSAGVVHDGIDLRGAGGFIIWWPAHDCEYGDVDARSAPDHQTGAKPCEPEKPKRRGGRAPGVPNKATRIAKEAILAAEPHRFLVRVMEGRKFRRAGSDGGRRTVDCLPTLEQSIEAAQILLRKIAPDMRATEFSGPDGAPIQQELQIEAAARIAAVFAGASTNRTSNGEPLDGVAERLDDQALGVVQSVNFLMASREAQAGRDAPPEPAEPKPLPQPSVAAVPTELAPEPIPAQPVEPTPPPVHHALSFVESALSIVARPPDREGLPPCYELRRGSMLLRRAAWDVVLAEARKQSGGDLGPWLVQEPRP